jgi:hypothetical protein
MNGRPTAAAAGKIDVGGDLTVNRLGFGAMRITGSGIAESIGTLLERDGTTLPGVLCDESRWLAASGDVCPVCGKPTRYTPDVLDELAAAVIETGGSARQIAADLMPAEYPAAAKLRFPAPPREAGDSQS